MSWTPNVTTTPPSVFGFSVWPIPIEIPGSGVLSSAQPQDSSRWTTSNPSACSYHRSDCSRSATSSAQTARPSYSIPLMVLFLY